MQTKPHSVALTVICLAMLGAGAVRSAPATPAQTYQVDARVFVAGDAARAKGGQGLSQLKPNERSMAGFLGYRDYKLLTSGARTVKLNQPLVLTFAGGRSVSITPVKDTGDRVTLEIKWDVKTDRWRKNLFFKRNSRTLLGGPKIEDGGMYLVSVLVK
jgi:hypothetical protein